MAEQDNSSTPVEPQPPASASDMGMSEIPNPPAASEPMPPATEIPARAEPVLATPAVPPPTYYQAPATNVTNTWAIVSLVASILAWVGLFGLGGVVGVITGIVARGQIRDSAGRETGDGIALAGIIIGGINIFLTCIGILCIFAFFAIVPFMGASSGR